MSAYEDTMKRAWATLQTGGSIARAFALVWDEARAEERRDAMRMDRAQREAAKLRARSPGDHTDG